MRWITLGLIMLTLLSYLSPHIPPDQLFGGIAMLGLVYPVLLLLQISLLVYWAIRKDRYFFFPLVCILIGWSFLSRNFGTHSRVEDINSANSIKVMSFNASSGRYFDSDQDFIDYIQRQSPEILCLQESAFQYRLEYLETNDSQPLHYAYSDKKSLTIASIYPIEDYGSFGFLNQANGILYADIKIGEEMLRVYCVHLKSNGITSMVDQVAEKQDWQEKKTWRQIKYIFKGYLTNATFRVDQAKELAAHIELSPYPVLLCGDFNDVPQSYVYETLSENMTDHFQAKGQGIGSTFSGNIPFLRIDYIMSSPSLEVVDSRIIKDGYSDHYPIVSFVQRR